MPTVRPISVFSSRSDTSWLQQSVPFSKVTLLFISWLKTQSRSYKTPYAVRGGRSVFSQPSRLPTLTPTLPRHLLILKIVCRSESHVQNTALLSLQAINDVHSTAYHNHYSTLTTVPAITAFRRQLSPLRFTTASQQGYVRPHQDVG